MTYFGGKRLRGLKAMKWEKGKVFGLNEKWFG